MTPRGLHSIRVPFTVTSIDSCVCLMGVFAVRRWANRGATRSVITPMHSWMIKSIASLRSVIPSTSIRAARPPGPHQPSAHPGVMVGWQSISRTATPTLAHCRARYRARGAASWRIRTGAKFRSAKRRFPNFGSDDFSRVDSQRQEAIWIAPEVGRWIARESFGTYYSDDSAADTPYSESAYRWSCSSGLSSGIELMTSRLQTLLRSTGRSMPGSLSWPLLSNGFRSFGRQRNSNAGSSHPARELQPRGNFTSMAFPPGNRHSPRPPPYIPLEGYAS
jgi:hypothetical protein